MNWDEACTEAKYQLGYRDPNIRLTGSEFEKMIFIARGLRHQFNSEGESNISILASEGYFNSKDWEKVRHHVFTRQHHLCADCKTFAQHLYVDEPERLGYGDDENCCIALCRTCLKARSGIA